MIKKVKELMGVQEEIDVIKNNIRSTTTSVSELKDEIAACREAMQEHDENFKAQTSELANELSSQLASIKEMQKEFEKELFQFKLLKSQLQKKVLDKFEEELDKELNLQMDTLKQDADQYKDLKNDLTQISGKVSALTDEIDKFTDISQNIKKGDFELKTFARQMLEMDKEKLELMKKIDTLERLVSKMRRQQPAVARH